TLLCYSAFLNTSKTGLPIVVIVPPNSEIRCIKLGPKGKNGKPAYVDYIVKLPERSLEEFCRWVYRFMGNAQFIYPRHLAEQHQKFARVLIDRYSSKAP
ncbi:MAG: hypothetical protein V7K92_13975, partial [Nostoc sp.]